MTTAMNTLMLMKVTATMAIITRVTAIRTKLTMPGTTTLLIHTATPTLIATTRIPDMV
jgi:hypothetical protein